MDWLWETAIIFGMFAVRLGVPLTITLLVGYWLRRLDAKWQAEAMLEWENSQVQQKFAEAGLLERLNQPCWEAKGCDPAKRAHCPACKNADIPCWMARRSADGRLPEECYDCERLIYGSRGRHVTV